MRSFIADTISDVLSCFDWRFERCGIPIPRSVNISEGVADFKWGDETEGYSAFARLRKGNCSGTVYHYGTVIYKFSFDPTGIL
jgi:hypothetical protein